jgi:hypothetical protein
MLPRAYSMFMRCHGLMQKTLKQIIWRKTIAIYNVFKKKTTKIILEKKHKKNKRRKTM